jgi:hypothetical protein
MSIRPWILTRREFVGTCAAASVAPAISKLLPLAGPDHSRAFALLGAGARAKRVVHALATLPSVRLAAIADPNLDAAAALAAEFAARRGRSVPPRVTSFDHTVFADAGIEAVIVTSGTEQFARVASRAAAAGKATLIPYSPAPGTALGPLATSATESPVVRFASWAADDELASFLASKQGSSWATDARRHVSLDLVIPAAADPRSRAESLFAALAPAVGFAGSGIPTAMYVAEGMIPSGAGKSERTRHFAFSFPRSASLEIRVRMAEPPCFEGHALVRLTRLRFAAGSNTEAEFEWRGMDATPPYLERSVQLFAANVVQWKAERDQVGSLRDDLLAAYITENSLL